MPELKTKYSKSDRDPERFAGEIKQNEAHGDARARTSLQPNIKGAVTAREYSKAFGDLDLTGLSNELVSQAQAVQEGYLTRAEAMLMVQAHSLDAIYNSLAQQAIVTELTLPRCQGHRLCTSAVLFE